MRNRSVTERLLIQILHIYLLSMGYWIVAGQWIGAR